MHKSITNFHGISTSIEISLVGRAPGHDVIILYLPHSRRRRSFLYIQICDSLRSRDHMLRPGLHNYTSGNIALPTSPAYMDLNKSPVFTDNV